MFLEIEPAIPKIDVRFESNREKAIENVTTWVNEAGKMAFNARLAVSQKPGVRIPESAPKPAPKGAKP